MDARTTFDREPNRIRRRAAADRVPLLKRTWFRVGGLAVVAGWVAACGYFLIRLSA